MPRAKARKEEPVEAGSDVVMEDAPTSHQPESRDDEMSVDDGDDAGEAEEDEVEEEEEEEEEVQRVRLVCWFFSFLLISA
jgi:DNA-directed RNA polymerase I and III subunit RPAC2